MDLEYKAIEYANNKYPNALDVDAGYDMHAKWYAAKEGYIQGYLDSLNRNNK